MEEPETILPDRLFVNPIQWEINEQLLELSRQQPRTPGCPLGKIYVPEDFRNSLISSAHSSVRTGHPGVNKTYSTLQLRYWWPNMTSQRLFKDVFPAPCQKFQEIYQQVN